MAATVSALVAVYAGAMSTAPDPGALAGRSADEVLQLLAESVGGQAHARVVYGEPVRHEGVTIVPVARVRWGFGIGSGFKEAPMRTGGGGAIATPVGYLELRDGTCRYVPLASPLGSAVTDGARVAGSFIMGRLLGRRRPG